MTADAPAGEPGDAPADGPSRAPAENVDRDRLPSTSVSGTLGDATTRIADDPLLALPFVVAGVVLTAVDWLRARDPVPTTTPDLAGDVTVSIAYRVVPTGFRTTGLRPAALVDLELRYLGWVLGMELAALLAVGVAGWLTLSRAAGVERSRQQLVSYLGLVVAVGVLFRLFGLFDGLGLLAVFGLVVYAVVSVRLFAAPALVTMGSDVGSAIRRSRRLSIGEGATALGLVLVVGIATWLLGSVPVVGTLLSTAVVAPVHAVAAVAFVESVESAPNQ